MIWLRAVIPALAAGLVACAGGTGTDRDAVPLLVQIGHVKVSIGRKPESTVVERDRNEWLAIDFMPAPEADTGWVRRIDENRIVAMYLINKAAEALAAGRLDDAYAWSRAAVRQDRAEADALNTLALVYHRRGFAQAQQAQREGRWDDARLLFERDLARVATLHALHHGLAVAYAQLRRPDDAVQQLRLAQAHSVTHAQQSLYAAKLGRLADADAR